MHEPFESEPEAFRFVLLTVVAWSLITAAAVVVGTWFGFGVWLVLTAAVAGWYLARRGPVR